MNSRMGWEFNGGRVRGREWLVLGFGKWAGVQRDARGRGGRVRCDAKVARVIG